MWVGGCYVIVFQLARTRLMGGLTSHQTVIDSTLDTYQWRDVRSINQTLRIYCTGEYQQSSTPSVGVAARGSH